MSALAGTAEDASLFDCKSEVRSVPVGRFTNYRADLDGLLLPLVTGRGSS